jgi:uncharacterized protein
MLRDLRDLDQMEKAEHCEFTFCEDPFVVNTETSMCYQASPAILSLIKLLSGGKKVTEVLHALEGAYPKAELLDGMQRLLDWQLWYEPGKLEQLPLVPPVMERGMKIGGVNVNVTHACNLRCTYCYGDSEICPSGIGPAYAGPTQTMSLPTARRLVDFLVREGSKQVHISFFGGEPLLNFPAMKEFAGYARRATDRYGIKLGVGLFTNGTLIDGEVIDFLNEYGSGVTLSVDGPREAHDKNRPDGSGRGTWDTIMERMSLLRERLAFGRIEFRGSFTHAQVADGVSLLDYIAVAERHGAASLWAVPIVQAGCQGALTEKDLPYLRREYEKAAQYLVRQFEQTGSLTLFRNIVDRMAKTRFISVRPEFNECGCARGFVCPAPDGSLYGCHQMTGLEHWRMGHVFGDYSRELTREVCTHARVSTLCGDCGLRHFCGFGCLKNKLNATGSPFQADRSVECAIARLELEAAFYVNSKLPLTLDARTFQHIWGPANDMYRRILSVC